VREVHLYTVYDAPARPPPGTLRWLDVAAAMAKHGRDHLYLRLELLVGKACVSEEVVFLTAPRFVDLPKARTAVTLKRLTPTTVRLTFKSPVFQYRFAFELPGVPHHASDNFFALFPGEARSVEVTFSRPIPAAKLRGALTFRSLADTF
jgi:beta-mannosidase